MNHDSRNSSNLADSVRVAGDFFIYTASSHFNLFMHLGQRQVNILPQYHKISMPQLCLSIRIDSQICEFMVRTDSSREPNSNTGI